MEIDPVEYTKNSAEILRVSSQLKELRGQRDELNKKISELEKELMPFLTKQAEMTATLVGSAMPTIPTLPQNIIPNATLSAETVHSHAVNSNSALKQRILEFLRKCDEEVSAGDVAEALRIDPAVVREAMLALRSGTR